MISEGSRDTEDWSNDAENTALQHRNKSYLHLHLADAFIQSDLQLHSGYTFSLVHVFPGNRTHNLCATDAMLYHWATQEQIK